MQIRKQTKQRFVRQATQIAKRVKDFYKNKESIYLTLLSVVMVFMPYVHLFYYGTSDLKGDFFGFRWMSSFLFALALPSFMLASGLMIGYFSRKYKEDILKLLSALVTLSGCFYMVWTFWTTPSDFKDMSLQWYLTVLFGLTIGFFVLVRLIEKNIPQVEEKLKQKVAALQRSLVNYFGMLKRWEYRTDNHPEFLEDLYETTKDSNIIE